MLVSTMDVLMVTDDAMAGQDELLDRVGHVCSSIEVLVRALHRFFGGARDIPQSCADGAVPAHSEGGISQSMALATLGRAFWSELVRSLCFDCLLPAWQAIETRGGGASSQTPMVRMATDKDVPLLAQITSQMASLDACLRQAGLVHVANFASFAAELRVHAAEEHARSLLSQVSFSHRMPVFYRSPLWCIDFARPHSNVRLTAAFAA